MKDMWTNLPQDITRKILERLPIRSIMRCKYVCKSWRNLIEGGDFTTSCTPEPGLVFVRQDTGYAVCDEDCRPLFGFDLPPTYRAHNRAVIGSANGLILLKDGCTDTLFVCNPLTREYVELPHLPTHTHSCTFGFGVSKLTGQYKIVCGDQFWSYYVYTLGGEDSWRSIAATPPRVPRDYAIFCKGLSRYDLKNNHRHCCFRNLRVMGDYAVFYDGNLHWLEYDSYSNLFVSCFDLETELFTRFSLPVDGGGKRGLYRLCVMEGRLYFSVIIENSPIVIWWMNNYGAYDTWDIGYTFFRGPAEHGLIYPLKVLSNDDLLFAVDRGDRLFIYLKNTEDRLDSFETYCHLLQRPTHYYSNIAIYTPSFLSLKTMGIRNVQTLGFN